METIRLNARVTPNGRLVLEKKVKLPPGPVVVKISQGTTVGHAKKKVKKAVNGSQDRNSFIIGILAQLDSMTFPPDVNASKSDDELIYGK